MHGCHCASVTRILRKQVQRDAVCFSVAMGACEKALAKRAAKLWVPPSFLPLFWRAGRGQRMGQGPGALPGPGRAGPGPESSSWAQGTGKEQGLASQALAQQRLRHDAVTFGNAVCAWAPCHIPRTVRRRLERKIVKNKAMTKGGHWLGVLELLQCMQSEALVRPRLAEVQVPLPSLPKAVKLDTVVCNSALTACANHSRWQAHVVSFGATLCSFPLQEALHLAEAPVAEADFRFSGSGMLGRSAL